MTTQSDAADVLERIHGLACRLSGHLLASHLSVDYNAQGRAIYVNDCERCGTRVVKRFARERQEKKPSGEAAVER